MTYQFKTTYIKRTNLLDYFRHNSDVNMSKASENHYAKERIVTLVVLSRNEGNHKFCLIKCPINPVPVRGEFEMPNMNVLHRFLEKEGWEKLSTERGEYK